MDKITFTFGRHNPPTIGHKKLWDYAFDFSNKNNSDIVFFASKTNDNNKNPLTFSEKLKFIKLLYGEKYYKTFNKNKNIRTIFDILNFLKDSKYKHVYFIVGQDRIKEFKKMLKPYINDFDFTTFKILEAGKRSEQSKNKIEKISSSLIRNAVKLNNYNNFKIGFPKNSDEQTMRELFVKMSKKLVSEDNCPNYWDYMIQRYKQWYFQTQIDEEESTKDDFLVIDKNGKGHLKIRKNGKFDHRLMGAAYAALTVGYRGNKYKGPDKIDALNKLKKIYKKEKMPLP